MNTKETKAKDFISEEERKQLFSDMLCVEDFEELCENETYEND